MYKLNLPTTTKAKFGRLAVLRGRIAPGKAGVTVRIARFKAGKYVSVGAVKTSAGGLFQVRIPTAVRGAVKLRISVGKTKRLLVATVK